ncbi:MAG: hypothetical protein IKF55_03205 [Oscillospiraceae bacterium]|nr:hypothetical protein [Oscillospiraceae bacterium]
MSYQEYLVKEAQLPSIPPCPDMSDPSNWNDEMRAQNAAWWEAKEAHQAIVIPDAAQFQDFVRESSQRLHEGQEASNFLYSPVSLWFCLHTLAALTENDSRAQILDVIGPAEEKDGDEHAEILFRSLYWEDDASVCVPALSIWLNKGTLLSETLLDRLAAGHASVFQGSMGDMGFNQALRLWLNEQTRGLLNDYVSELCFSADAGLTICSTLYMKNGWNVPFSKDETAPDVFYTDDGEVTTDFMHSSSPGVVFRGDGFTAMVLPFQDGGGVTFILPDSGLSPEELLSGEEVFRFLFSENEWDNCRYGRVNLSLPKMDCLSDMSLRNALEKMGITDIFDPQKLQFSSEISSDSKLLLSDLQQYGRLIVNEDGVEAAAATLTLDGALLMQPDDEIDFTLNRPFLYAVMSESSIPMFVGTYHRPE